MSNRSPRPRRTVGFTLAALFAATGVIVAVRSVAGLTAPPPSLSPVQLEVSPTTDPEADRERLPPPTVGVGGDLIEVRPTPEILQPNDDGGADDGTGNDAGNSAGDGGSGRSGSLPPAPPSDPPPAPAVGPDGDDDDTGGNDDDDDDDDDGDGDDG